jgi:phospholipase C
VIDAPHLGDLLEQKGLQWKVYAEDYPGDCFLGATSGNYARKHVPFISFADVQNDPARCARIVEASQFDADLKASQLPDFSFYAPNLRDDGHNTGAAYADRWLSQRFGSLLQDSRFRQDMLFVVTFDESESLFGPNHILTVLYGDSVKPGSQSAQSYNHYSLLRLIEDELGLGNLGQGDATANPIQEVWK